jgi:hypothetical protein
MISAVSVRSASTIGALIGHLADRADLESVPEAVRDAEVIPPRNDATADRS